MKTFLVGYVPTGYILYHPKTKKLIETKHARFVERYVYGDIYRNEDSQEEFIISRVDNTVENTPIESLENEGQHIE